MQIMLNSVLSTACDTFVKCPEMSGYLDSRKVELGCSDSSTDASSVAHYRLPSLTYNHTFTIKWVEASEYDIRSRRESCYFHDKSKTLLCRNEATSLERVIHLISKHLIQFFAPIYGYDKNGVLRAMGDKATTVPSEFDAVLMDKASQGVLSLASFEDFSTYNRYVIDKNIQRFYKFCKEKWNISSAPLSPFRLTSASHYFVGELLDGGLNKIRLDWIQRAQKTYCTKKPTDSYSCYSLSLADFVEPKNKQEHVKDLADWYYELRESQINYSPKFISEVRQIWDKLKKTNTKVSLANQLWEKEGSKNRLGYDLLGSTLTINKAEQITKMRASYYSLIMKYISDFSSRGSQIWN